MQHLSYQLYSSRNFPPLDATLGMLAGLGYRNVEGFGGLYADPVKLAELKHSLARHQLAMPTGHFGFDMVAGQPELVLAIARDLGLKAVFVPAPPTADYREGRGDWQAFAAALAVAGRPYWETGLHFGYHNHHWEFVPEDGRIPLDILLGASSHLMLEFDVAWAVRGHQAPLDWIRKYRGRLIAAHVKDIAPAGECFGEDGWADVGHGTMDWAAIHAALKAAGTEYLVMEHDNPADDRRFARRSLETVGAWA